MTQGGGGSTYDIFRKAEVLVYFSIPGPFLADRSLLLRVPRVDRTRRFFFFCGVGSFALRTAPVSQATCVFTGRFGVKDMEGEKCCPIAARAKMRGSQVAFVPSEIPLHVRGHGKR